MQILFTVIMVLLVLIRLMMRISSSTLEKEPIVAADSKLLNEPKLKKIQLQKSDDTWEKDYSNTSPKDSISRGKKVLNRSRLKQSVLINEILRRKY